MPVNRTRAGASGSRTRMTRRSLRRTISKRRWPEAKTTGSPGRARPRHLRLDPPHRPPRRAGAQTRDPASHPGRCARARRRERAERRLVGARLERDAIHQREPPVLGPVPRLARGPEREYVALVGVGGKIHGRVMARCRLECQRRAPAAARTSLGAREATSRAPLPVRRRRLVPEAFQNRCGDGWIARAEARPQPLTGQRAICGRRRPRKSVRPTSRIESPSILPSTSS